MVIEAGIFSDRDGTPVDEVICSRPRHDVQGIFTKTQEIFLPVLKA